MESDPVIMRIKDLVYSNGYNWNFFDPTRITDTYAIWIDNIVTSFNCDVIGKCIFE